MIRKLYIIILILLPTLLLSQSRFGYRFPDNIISSKLSISGDFYAGIENPIDFSGQSDKNDEYRITTNNGRINENDTQMAVLPFRPGSIRFLINRIENGEEKYLGYTVANVRKLPEPRLMLDTLIISSKISLSKEQIIKSNNLSIFLSNDIPDSDYWFSINQYTIGYFYGGVFVSENVNGNYINQAVKALIANMPSNKEISINVIITSETLISKNLPIAKIMVY